MRGTLFAIQFSSIYFGWKILVDETYATIRSTGAKNSIIRTSRTNKDFYNSKTFGATTFIGVTPFIDINAAIDIATLKHNAQKFFILFHFDRSFENYFLLMVFPACTLA
jgi:hypothetical protein